MKRDIAFLVGGEGSVLGMVDIGLSGAGHVTDRLSIRCTSPSASLHWGSVPSTFSDVIVIERIRKKNVPEPTCIKRLPWHGNIHADLPCIDGPATALESIETRYTNARTSMRSAMAPTSSGPNCQ